MEMLTITGRVETQESEALVLAFFEDDTPPLTGTAAALDDALKSQLSTILTQEDFKGKRNETLVLYTYGLVPAKRILLVGLGKRESFTLDRIRQAASTAVRKARDLGLSEVTVAFFDGNGTVTRTQAAEAIAEGTLLGLYRFNELKTQREGERPDPKRLAVLVNDSDIAPEVESGLQTGATIAESTMLARDLINRPANIATPTTVAETAQKLAASTGLNCRVLDKAEIEALGMHLLLSVNQGGNEPARMVILEHNADRTDLPTVVLVGKGITFDTGGISLKHSEGMEAMKGDMGGAAAVLGALRAVALLGLPLHVVGLTPLTENMPDALATKPGDVVSSLKGLTVEIINTDAEGRLILADALTYAGEFQPTAIFDIATLTGGRIVALGDHAAAVLGDETLIARLRSAGDVTGERVWPLPLFEAYGEQLESDVADLKNVGGRAASTITGGFFLSKFVPENVPWVHIDIAGLGLTQKAGAYWPKGGTGFGVRLFVEILRNWES